MIGKVPRNYSNDFDRRKQRLDSIVGKLNSIPDPTTEDEGKVLKVDDEGKYNLLPDGGAQVMTVAVTYDETTQDYSADKTHAQIIAAINAGVIVSLTYDGRSYVYAGIGKESAGTPIYFSYTQSDSESQMIEKVFEIDEDERMVFSEHNIAEELPVVTSDDNGRVLVVENGVWGKGNITTGGVIGEKSKALLTYCSSVNPNTNIPYFDIQDHTEFRPSIQFHIDTTNLKVMLIVNNTLVAYNKPIEEVFDLTYSKPRLGIGGGVTWNAALTSTYAALLPNIQQYDLGYFRFMSDIIVGDPV